jgi:hypothetical protein
MHDQRPRTDDNRSPASLVAANAPQAARIGNWASALKNQRTRCSSLSESIPDVAEVSKLREIIKLLESLQEAAHRLTEDIERRDALREIRAFQLRVAALVRRTRFQ